MKLQKRWMGILLSMYLVAGSVQAKDVLPIGESVRLTTEPTRTQRFAVAPVQVNGEQLPAYGIRVPSPGLDEETLSFTPEQTILQSSATAAQLQRLAVYAFDGSWFLVPRDWILKYAELGVNGSEWLEFAPEDGNGLLRYIHTGACVGCVQREASAFFPEARRDAQANDFMFYRGTDVPIKSVRLRPHIIAYQAGTHGRRIDGLVYYQRDSNLPHWRMEVSLPLAQQDLSQPILNRLLPKR